MARVQFWDGKIPNSEMMKLMARNGGMLSCGCELPARPTAAGFMGPVGDDELNGPPVHPDQ